MSNNFVEDFHILVVVVELSKCCKMTNTLVEGLRTLVVVGKANFILRNACKQFCMFFHIDKT